jgi:hypothetical protein
MLTSDRVTIATRLAVACAVLFFCNADAVINPELFREQLISRASEWLTIDVVAAERRERSAGIVEVTASAVVREVHHSATGLEAGMPILISYTLNVAAEQEMMAKMEEQGNQGWAGMQSEGLPVVIEADQTYNAYLTANSGEGVSGRVYRPAAAIHSFESPDVPPPGPGYSK